MSKCSVFRILKSKCSHCTLLRPKYCALSDVEAKRRKRKATASLRIESTSPFENSDSAWQPAAKPLPRQERHATPRAEASCCKEVNGRDLSPNFPSSAPNLDDRLPPRVRATITTTTEASGAFARRTGRRNVQRLNPVPPRRSLRRSRKSTSHQGPSESLRSVQRQTCIRSPRLLYLAPETACLCGAREV